jgi:hypothetical protein
VSSATKRKEHEQAQEAQELFMKIAGELVGRDSGVQGNAISMLLGTWLAGHFYTDDDHPDAVRATHQWRARLLTLTTTAALQHAAVQDEQRLQPRESLQ